MWELRDDGVRLVHVSFLSLHHGRRIHVSWRKIGAIHLCFLGNEVAAPIFSRPDYSSRLRMEMTTTHCCRRLDGDSYTVYSLALLPTLVPICGCRQGCGRQFGEWTSPRCWSLFSAAAHWVSVKMGSAWINESLTFGG
jgi:hypothetical protein